MITISLFSFYNFLYSIIPHYHSSIKLNHSLICLSSTINHYSISIYSSTINSISISIYYPINSVSQNYPYLSHPSNSSSTSHTAYSSLSTTYSLTSNAINITQISILIHSIFTMLYFLSTLFVVNIHHPFLIHSSSDHYYSFIYSLTSYHYSTHFFFTF
jgi:hypothetical protein